MISADSTEELEKRGGDVKTSNHYHLWVIQVLDGVLNGGRILKKSKWNWEIFGQLTGFDKIGHCIMSSDEVREFYI